MTILVKNKVFIVQHKTTNLQFRIKSFGELRFFNIAGYVYFIFVLNFFHIQGALRKIETCFNFLLVGDT